MARNIPMLLLVLAGTWFVSARAADPQIAGQPIPRGFPVADGVQSYSYRSRIMDRTYDIVIGFPEHYRENPQRRYPVLLITDGNRFFPAVNLVARGLGEDIEQPLLIGIDTPYEEGEQARIRRRIYEFSPPGWTMKNEFGRRSAELCLQTLKVKPQDCVGGAPRFLQFITAELLPVLATLCRLNPDQLGLSGASAGGAFSAWVMFQEHSPFKRYIISSPVMAYGDGEILRQEARYAATHRDLPIGAYLSSGAREIDDVDFEWAARIVSGQAQLGAVLRSRKYPSLSLYSEIHQGLGHVDVIPTSFARGLRMLYAKQK